MFIQTENTPNPATVKFLPGRTVLAQGTAEFRAGEDLSASPLAARLMRIVGVKGVMLGRDFISVSKAGDTDWPMLKPMIMAALMEHLTTEQPILLAVAAEAAAVDDDPLVAQIKELIETRVRPAVRMDGGDIVFDRFEDGIVYLSMRGACAGCPSSTLTLKSGIENMLRHFVPEVIEVRQAEE